MAKQFLARFLSLVNRETHVLSKKSPGKGKVHHG